MLFLCFLLSSIPPYFTQRFLFAALPRPFYQVVCFLSTFILSILFLLLLNVCYRMIANHRCSSGKCLYCDVTYAGLTVPGLLGLALFFSTFHNAALLNPYVIFALLVVSILAWPFARKSDSVRQQQRNERYSVSAFTSVPPLVSKSDLRISLYAFFLYLVDLFAWPLLLRR